jgi:hypothetical protein
VNVGIQGVGQVFHRERVSCLVNHCLLTPLVS